MPTFTLVNLKPKRSESKHDRDVNDDDKEKSHGCHGDKEARA